MPTKESSIPPLRILYAGTPDFAVPPLRALIRAGHEIAAVYTQPDRPAGRGRRLTSSPVKRCALEHGLSVRQPERLRGEAVLSELQAFAPDLMVVAAYGLILPKAVLETPRLGCINIHASLLPRWRGAAPIQRAILAGDRETGVTIMRMERGLDTGAMLHKLRCLIEPSMTAGQLHDRLMEMGARALMAILPELAEGRVQGESQEASRATYADKLAKAEAEMDWMQSAAVIDRQIRAFNPWPVAQTRLRDKVLRLWQARPVDREHRSPPGTVLAAEPSMGILVACGENALALQRLQLPGKKPVDAASFLNAHSVNGVVLG